MADEKTLKQENLNYVRGYIVANIILFWLFADWKIGSLMQGLNVNFGEATNKIIESVVISGLLYIATIICCGLISSNLKYVLVFWRLKNPLPGCRAFSHLMRNDPRVDPRVLEERLGPLPTDPMEENRLWYKLYKKHENENVVLEAQKNFLLMRELNSISFLFLIFLGTASFFVFNNQQTWTIYLIVLTGAFLATAIAARNYGARFAMDVLAAESVSK